MKNSLSTITMGGTITIVVFVIFLSIGLSVLFGFLIIHERKRYKAGKVHLGTKLLPLEKMIKDKLITARANTKFCITVVEIDNISVIKADGGGKSIKEITEAIASRIVREYHYPIAAARQGKSRIVYIAKNVSDKKNAAIISNIRHSLNQPFINIDGGEINIQCNIAVIKFPQCGNEYSLILRNIELALADATCNDGVSIAKKTQEGDNVELNEYLKIKRAVDKGNIILKYEAFINAFNKERSGYISVISGKDAIIAAISGQTSGWLDKWIIGEACRLIDRLGDKSALPVILTINSELKDNENTFIELLKEIKKKAEFIEQAVICIKASDVYAIGDKLMDLLLELSVAINIDCAENIEQYETVISRLKPRYALIDSQKLSADQVENVEKIMELYNIISIMINVDNKSGYNAARHNGIELLSGSLYGDLLTANEIVDSVS